MWNTGNYYCEESLILSAFSGDTGNYDYEESLIFKFILAGIGERLDMDLIHNFIVSN